MPALPTLQNSLLQILREQLVPWTREAHDLQVMLADPPLTPPDGASVRRYIVSPLRDDEATRNARHGLFHQSWHRQGFHIARYTCLGCILEGEADLEICTTQDMVERSGEPDGQGSRYILMLPSRTFFLIPAGVPHNNGSRLHWDRPHPETAHSRILWTYILPSGVVCHTCRTSGTDHDSDPSLFVRDTLPAMLIELLREELQERAQDYEAVVQAHLTAFFVRLRRNLAAGRPLAGDRMLGLFAGGQKLESSPASTRVLAVQRACAYIRSHLEEPLNPALIARHAYVSTSHLNRIFEAERGQSVMKYVTQLRIETAQSLLEGTDLPVAEISLLVGYKYLSHFSQTFRQWTQMSPVAYRKQQASMQDRP